MKGYIQVYTGDGKGKTTAAIGLSIRAAGAGLRIFIGQFIKMGEYSELKALKKFADQITIRQFGPGRFIKGKPSDSDIEAARKGLETIKTIMFSGQYDVVVMEKANVDPLNPVSSFAFSKENAVVAIRFIRGVAIIVILPVFVGVSRWCLFFKEKYKLIYVKYNFISTF